MKHGVTPSEPGRRVADTLAAALTSGVTQQSLQQFGLALAYSGGLDSTVLLHVLWQYCRQQQIPLHAFHVHHGLSPNADQWLNHCEQQCRQRQIGFAFRRVNLSAAGDGIEAAARRLRYRALAEMCAEHQIPLLLTAHHQDDQAETLLMQLLRGAGLTGLSGMAELGRAPELFGHSGLLLGRPLLDSPRSELERYASLQQLAYVEDESNQQTRYRRNALRHQVLPLLQQIQPGCVANMARSAHHLAQADAQLHQLIRHDYHNCLAADGALELSALARLDSERQSLMLRQWLREQHLRMPSGQRLKEMLKQMLGAREDAQMCIQHDAACLRRYRGRLYLSPVPQAPEDRLAVAVNLDWHGEAALYLPEFAGHLLFSRADYGLDPAWLQQPGWSIRRRNGGERLKNHPTRPQRDMKHHYQQLAIPAWQRASLPLLWHGRQLLFAAGVGMDVRYCTDGPDRIRLEWQPDLE